MTIWLDPERMSFIHNLGKCFLTEDVNIKSSISLSHSKQLLKLRLLKKIMHVLSDDVVIVSHQI